MVTTVDAIYEDGVLRPLSPLPLDDGAHVQVSISEETPGNAHYQSLTPEERQRYAAEFIAKMAALPIEGTDDGFSSADHDDVLYGKDRRC